MRVHTLEARLDITEFRAWLTGRYDAHVGHTVNEYNDPLGRFFFERHNLRIRVEDERIVVLGSRLSTTHKPWSKQFVALLRNNYAGHDWLNGRDALHILALAELAGTIH